MGFNSAFKGLMGILKILKILYKTIQYYAILTFYEASLWKWRCTQAQGLIPVPHSGVS